MRKKYQIFVSSTYSDLVEERQLVSRAILDLGHIPAGMEMFPAADVEQLTYIKKVIDECDYYILIIGARYGSLDPQGVSYTEREYDYALEAGKTVLAFLHADIDKVPLGRTDKDESRGRKLSTFMKKVSTGRLIQTWEHPLELRSKATVSLVKAFSESPQNGWIRADDIPDENIVYSSLRIREENEALKTQILEMEDTNSSHLGDIADLSEKFDLGFINVGRNKSIKISYLDLLKSIAPDLISPNNLYNLSISMRRGLVERFNFTDAGLSVHRNSIQDAIIHLMALGLVKITESDKKDNSTLLFQLTSLGIKTWKDRTYARKKGAGESGTAA